MSLYTLMTNTTAEICLKEAALSEVKAYLSERGLVVVPVIDTGNLTSAYYAALDDLYNRGWKDRHQERDYDPRGTNEYQSVLDMIAAQGEK